MVNLLLELNCVRKKLKFNPSRKFSSGILKSSLEKNLIKSSEKKIVLENISFSVFNHEIIGILGRSGSGKTPLLELISGIYKPDSGICKVNGTCFSVAKPRVLFYQTLNVKDNILLQCMAYGLSKQKGNEKIDMILKNADVTDETFKVNQLSFESQWKLIFSIAFEFEPDLFLVEEFTPPCSSDFEQKCFDKFLELKIMGKSIIHISKNMEFFEKVCDRILVLDDGKVKMFDKPDKVLSKYNKILN